MHGLSASWRRRLIEGYFSPYRRSGSPTPYEGHFSSQEQSPFPHADQPQRVRIGQLSIRYPSPIIAYFEDEVAGLLLNCDCDGRGLRMAIHIGQDFLENAEHGRRSREG